MANRCPRCRPAPLTPEKHAAYSYLLGLHLGDGHLVTATKVPVLRDFCADSRPGLTEQCGKAMLSVLAAQVQRVQKRGLRRRPELFPAPASPASATWPGTQA
jgi:hypothetical protein